MQQKLSVLPSSFTVAVLIAAFCSSYSFAQQPNLITLTIPLVQHISPAPACGGPFVDDGMGHCHLTSNVLLTNTLQIEPNTHLVCDENTQLVPNLNSPPNAYIQGKPFTIAILLNQASNVTIENCVIGDPNERFDVGVVILNGANNVIGPKNNISANYTGVLLMGADGNQINGNDVDFLSDQGMGIALIRKCKGNSITSNNVIGEGNSGYNNPPIYSLCADCGITSFDPPLVALFHFVIESAVIQLPNAADSRNESNTFQQDTVKFSVPASYQVMGYGIAAGTRSNGTLIQGNTVHEGPQIGIAAAGIRQDLAPTTKIDNGQNVLVPNIPGNCTTGTNRYCVTASQCDQNATCSNPQPVTLDGRASGTVIEGNLLDAQYGLSAIWGGATSDLSIKANEIKTPYPQNRVIWLHYGISLSMDALETAWVTRNVVSNANFGLFLDHLFRNFANNNPKFRAADHFGATVAFNDITGNGHAIGVSVQGNCPPLQPWPWNWNAYCFPTELSGPFPVYLQSGGTPKIKLVLRGNYWGRRCWINSQPGGFLRQDSPNSSLIKDSHPFGHPVAQTPDSQKPCW